MRQSHMDRRQHLLTCAARALQISGDRYSWKKWSTYLKKLTDLLRDTNRELLSDNASIATEDSFASMPDERKKLVLLGCTLNPYELGMLMKFATRNSAINHKAILEGEWINACLREGHLVPEEPYEVDHDLRGFFDGLEKGRIRVTNKAAKVFAGLGFYLSSYLEPHMARLGKVLIAAGGTIIEQEDLILPTATLEDESLKKYIVINEDEPLSSRDIRKSIDERSEEGIEFYRKTGSPRFIGYTTIADAVVSLDSGILNKKYGGECDALISKHRYH